MALINCPECGKEVSDRASTCIHCGYPMAAMPKPANMQADLPVQNDSNVKHKWLAIVLKIFKIVITFIGKAIKFVFIWFILLPIHILLDLVKNTDKPKRH